MRQERPKLGTRVVAEACCKKCGYVWEPQVPLPKKCPKCQQYAWWLPKKEGRKS